VKIGPYEVLSELGRGGMGVVYRVRGPSGQEAALKLLSNVSAESFARFERERRLLAALGEEQGFVGLLDAGVSAEGAWLVMPFLPGGTLRQKLEAGPLGVPEAVALGIELAQALGAAHERGIVHRDVKPENVLFTAAGQPLLADLGLGKHFDPLAEGGSRSVELTVHGSFKGTAGYMAPEQIDDAGTVGPAADVFALGAVLHECLSGRPAFAGATVLDVLGKVSSGTVEPLGGDVPRWLEEVVRKALALDPRARFAHGGALAEALRSGGLVGSYGKGLAHPRGRRGLLPLVLGAALGGVVLGVLAVALGRPASRVVENPAPNKPSGLLRAKAPASSEAPRSALDLARLAYLKVNAGDTEGALADANKAIELDPVLAMAWANRGAARGRKGDWDGSIADLSRALDLDPKLVMVWRDRAIARGKKGDRDGKIADLSKAIEVDPTFVTAWVLRGFTRGEKGDPDGEISDETRAIELDSRSAEAWACRAAARAAKGDLEGVIADETRAIELHPNDAGTWTNRGSARRDKGDLDCAIADESRAIELDPRCAAAWAIRGAARAARHDADSGIADETRAIELDPMFTAAWMNRGVARVNKGDVQGGIADFERALELEPDGRYAAKIRDNLAVARTLVR
jgi:tetratricopeptide (TPR) repeat protein